MLRPAVLMPRCWGDRSPIVFEVDAYIASLLIALTCYAPLRQRFVDFTLFFHVESRGMGCSRCVLSTVGFGEECLSNRTYIYRT